MVNPYKNVGLAANATRLMYPRPETISALMSTDKAAKGFTPSGEEALDIKGNKAIAGGRYLITPKTFDVRISSMFS